MKVRRILQGVITASLLYWLVADAAIAFHAGTGHDCGFSTSDGSAHFTCAYSGAVSSGDLLIGCSRIEGGRLITAYSDSVNGSWTLLDTASFNAANKHATCYYFQNSGAGTPTVTVTENGGGGATGTVMVEAFTGVKTSSALVAASHTDGTGSTAATKTCASVTATASGQLIFGFISLTGGSSTSPNSSETERFETAFEQQIEDKLTSGAGGATVSWAFSPNDDGGCVTAIFDLAASTGGVNPLDGPMRPMRVVR